MEVKKLLVPSQKITYKGTNVDKLHPLGLFHPMLDLIGSALAIVLSEKILT